MKTKKITNLGKDKLTAIVLAILILLFVGVGIGWASSSPVKHWFHQCSSFFSSWKNQLANPNFNHLDKNKEENEKNKNSQDKQSSVNHPAVNHDSSTQQCQCQCPPTQEERVIKVVKKASPAVVSIIITKELPVVERHWKEWNPFGDDFLGDPFNFKFRVPEYRQRGTKKQEVGGGTGFVISNDGLILTNKHVVADKNAEYTVLMNDGKKYPAQVLARDPVHDLAIIKIKANHLRILPLDDSDKLQIGQTVIAIGNALGEFRNTVSVGVISGLRRSITAGGAGIVAEHLNNVIQTDAAINPGNSGGPLLDLNGKVVGINVAVAQGAQNIGFTLPINLAKKDIQQVKKNGQITYPFLGVRYVMINQEIKEKNHLSVDYGALIIRGQSPTDLAVVPGGPADKAGLQENDIILKIDGIKIDQRNPLSEVIQKKNVGDWVTLEILHRGKSKTVKVKLGSR